MEYAQKRSLVSLVTLVLVYLSVYSDIYRYLQNGHRNLSSLHFWGNLFFTNVLCLILVRTIALILFDVIHKRMTGQGRPKIKDERDKKIELRAIHASYYLLVVGILFSMVLAMRVDTVAPVFLTAMSSLMLAGAATDIIRFISYQRGS